ncbi:hypothetical protein OOK41_22525 [Micromonospora sp. NBC_01655]|uniref:hypothetical protein n=1 Tax=unclassified Micromonospora TaxID=2617518 RepID=UPI000E43A951|nr:MULTISPECIES: hypothetical protein [unclassified Micromonospora]MCX4473051.1 hypothetical protein [Micromonospora sp. NBC_01655]
MRIALLCVVSVVQFGLCVRPLVEYAYQPRWVAVAAFTVLALVTATCGVWVVRRMPIPAAVVVIGTVATLAASAGATHVLPPGGHFGTPDWSFGLVGWHLLLLLLERVPVLLTALAVHLTASLGQFLLAGVPDRAEIGAAGIVAFGTASIQLAVVPLSRMLHRRSRQAMSVTAERDRLITRVMSAEQWEREQRTVFAGQLGVTLPLLADLADGVLDPRDDDTRRRCCLAATQLRRLFAENDEVPDPLVHEVTACADEAERRGVEVSLAVSGAAVAVPSDVRRELTSPVVATLAAARSYARVSVLRTHEDVRVAVMADVGTNVVTATSPLVEIDCDTYGECVRMEARWRTRNS